MTCLCSRKPKKELGNEINQFIDPLLSVTHFISVSSLVNFNSLLRFFSFDYESIGFNSVLVSISVITQTNNLRHRQLQKE